MCAKRYVSVVWLSTPLRLLCIAYVVTVALLAYDYGTEIFFDSPPNYTGATLLDRAMWLVRGENIYTSDISRLPFTVNMYGPVYFLLQYPFLVFSGPTFLYGELFSVASHVISAFFAGLIMKRLTGNTMSAAITGLVVLASPFVCGIVPLYRVDVLAQALSLAGIYTGITAKTRRMDCLSALLFAAAIYTKLTYALAGPATVFFFHVCQREKKKALVQGALLAGISGLVFGVCQWITAGGFFFNIIIANMLHYSLGSALERVSSLLFLSLGACAVIPELWRRKVLLPDAARFASMYLVFATIASMALGRAGSGFWYGSELEVALAFVFGVATTPIPDDKKKMGNNGWMLAIQLIIYWGMLGHSPYHMSLRSTYKAEVPRIKEIIAATDGPILADDYIGLLAQAGRPIYFEPTSMTQLYYAGRWSQEPFLTELRKGTFAVILMTKTATPNTHRWTRAMMEAIHERYYVASSIGDTEVWRKKE